jgi:hypothetical protein
VNGSPAHDAHGARYVHGAVFAREAPDALLVLPADERVQDPVLLSGTAIAMWEAFAAPATVRDVAMHLAARFATDAAEVERTIAPVVAELHACGALTETA